MAFLVKLVSLLILVKSIQLLILSQIHVQFDTSTQLVLEMTPSIVADKHFFESDLARYGICCPSLIASTLEKLVSWDAVYFANLFKTGQLEYEHQWVFGPLWWRIIHFITSHVSHNYYWILSFATTVSCACHLATCVSVYYLTQEVFHDVKMSERASLMSVLTPAGIFMTSPYSESLCSSLSMFGLLVHEWSTVDGRVVNVPFYLFSGVLFGLSVTVRSNAVLLGVIFIYDFLITLQSRTVPLIPLVAGIIMGTFLVGLQYIPYSELCPGREWCDATVPSLTLYAQKHYWNNGFLKYWTPNNIPNFLFALPTVFIFAKAVWAFRADKRIRHLVIVSLLFVVLNVTAWHVQIITRISTFLPLGYWYVAHDASVRSKWATWCVIWIIVQTGLFGMFLPPA